MSKKVEEKLATARKWLDRNAGVGATVKPALAALAAAEKALAEAQAAKAKYAAAVSAKQKAVVALDAAMAKAKTEKKLKVKESRLQSKLASLVETDKPEKAEKA